MLAELFLRIAVAAGLSSLIGLEREIHGQPAGLRTHMILGVGAALAAILSISYSQFLSNPDIKFKRVVFPQPEGPIIEQNSPFKMSSLSLLIAEWLRPLPDFV